MVAQTRSRPALIRVNLLGGDLAQALIMLVSGFPEARPLLDKAAAHPNRWGTFVLSAEEHAPVRTFLTPSRCESPRVDVLVLPQ